MRTVIADTGAIISLALIECTNLIDQIFGDFYIASAVWQELNTYRNPNFSKEVLNELETKVVKIKSSNQLGVVMDYGESESVILYEELEADYLLIDDKKARFLAESMGVNCIGSLGLLIEAKSRGLVDELRPKFIAWLDNERYFSLKLLNAVLDKMGEERIEV